MRMQTNTNLQYKNGVISSTTDEVAPKTEFEYLPFGPKDSYVIGFNVTTITAKEIWMGPRIIFGTDTKGNDLGLFLTADRLVIAQGGEVLYQKNFPRNLKTDYRIDMFVEPNALSVWVNDILMIDTYELPNKATAKTGIIFEYTIASVSNIDMYYTNQIKYISPEVPEIPMLKEISTNQYNAADWMDVTIGGQSYAGYFQNQLRSTDSTTGYTYVFENIPVSDDMSYYYSATYRVDESDEV